MSTEPQPAAPKPRDNPEPPEKPDDPEKRGTPTPPPGEEEHPGK